MKKQTEGNNSFEVETLSPVVSDIYKKQVEAIKNGMAKGATNIGITSPYGGGKSSLIKTLLKDETVSSKAIKASFADLPGKDEHVNGRAQIEKSLVQQVLFSCEAKKLNGSRIFRAGDKRNWFSWLGLFGGILLLCLAVALAFVSLNHKSFNITFAIPFLSDLWNCIVSFWPFVCAFMIATSALLIILSSSKMRIKIQDVEIELEKDSKANKDDSLLSRYFDELVYFFKKSKRNILILEDLDRFEGCKETLFVDFRQLNIALNGSEDLKFLGHITFIYCFNDSIFGKEGQLQKFFDLIIPVVPVINSGNSIAVIKSKLSGVNELKKCVLEEGHEDWRFLSLVASYADDMRVLISTLNEYRLVYSRNIETGVLTEAEKKDIKRDFLLCFYHNLYPEEYEDLFTENSEYRVAVDVIKESKALFIKKRNDLLKSLEAKTKAPERLQIPNKYYYMINGAIASRSVSSFYSVGYSSATPADGIKTFTDKNAKVSFRNQNGYTNEMTIGEIEKALGINLYDEIEAPQKSALLAANNEYQELARELNNLPSDPIEFAKKYPEEAFPDEMVSFAALNNGKKKVSGFMKAMILNGYFNDALLDGLLSKNDLETVGSTSYIKRALIEKTKDLTLIPVLNPFETCKKLPTYFFDSPNIINADIFEALLAPGKAIEDGAKKLSLMIGVLNKNSSAVRRKKNKLVCMEVANHPRAFVHLLKNKKYMISCLKDSLATEEEIEERKGAIERIIRSSDLDIGNQDCLPELIKGVWTDNPISDEESKRLIKYAKSFEQSGFEYMDIAFARDSSKTKSFLSESNAWELNKNNLSILLEEDLSALDYDMVLQGKERIEELRKAGTNVDKIIERLKDNEIESRFLFIEAHPQKEASKDSMKKVLNLLEKIGVLPVERERFKNCLEEMQLADSLSVKLKGLLGYELIDEKTAEAAKGTAIESKE